MKGLQVRIFLEALLHTKVSIWKRSFGIRQLVLYSPPAFLATVSNTTGLFQSLWDAYKDIPDLDVDAAQTLFPCTIHENGAWCPGGATCTQSYLSSLCAAHTWSRSCCMPLKVIGSPCTFIKHLERLACGGSSLLPALQLASLPHATFETRTIGALMRPWTVSVITPLFVNMLETGIATREPTVAPMTHRKPDSALSERKQPGQSPSTGQPRPTLVEKTWFLEPGTFPSPPASAQRPAKSARPRHRHRTVENTRRANAPSATQLFDVTAHNVFMESRKQQLSVVLLSGTRRTRAPQS